MARQSQAIGSYAVDDEPVLNIDDTTVYLSARDQCKGLWPEISMLADYGEEQQDTKMDNGMTVGEVCQGNHAG